MRTAPRLRASLRSLDCELSALGFGFFRWRLFAVDAFLLVLSHGVLQARTRKYVQVSFCLNQKLHYKVLQGSHLLKLCIGAAA